MIRWRPGLTSNVEWMLHGLSRFESRMHSRLASGSVANTNRARFFFVRFFGFFTNLSGGWVRSPAIRAAGASISPAPAASGPKLPTGTAVLFCIAFTSAALSEGSAASWSAPTAAACGAAADVPKNRFPDPKNELMPPSVATTSGLSRTSAEASGGAGVTPLTGPNR